jgi:hypothetical protein
MPYFWVCLALARLPVAKTSDRTLSIQLIGLIDQTGTRMFGRAWFIISTAFLAPSLALNYRNASVEIDINK